MRHDVFGRRLLWPGMIIIAGLAVEVLSFYGTGPRSFLTFLLVGSVLVVAGVAGFVGSVVSEVARGGAGPSASADHPPG